MTSRRARRGDRQRRARVASARRRVGGGIGIDEHGASHDDYVDRLGHGTAVAAAIREKAPDAEIFAVKVFDRELGATGEALVAACEWALAPARTSST